jgi:hypothetical protein
MVQTGEGSDTHAVAVDWCKTLPLGLDLGGLRVVHACWHAASQQISRAVSTTRPV